jgi:hypothetical protein
MNQMDAEDVMSMVPNEECRKVTYVRIKDFRLL